MAALARCFVMPYKHLLLILLYNLRLLYLFPGVGVRGQHAVCHWYRMVILKQRL